MSQRQQLRQACGKNRHLARENSALRAELDRATREINELEATNAELQIEREAADVLMAEALDALSGR
jgi:predicted RNase H-like nuclease (RuvC/YqgF family)